MLNLHLNNIYFKNINLYFFLSLKIMMTVYLNLNKLILYEVCKRKYKLEKLERML
jgi:hypothetical protein